MYGVGILKGLGVTLKHFVNTFVNDIQYLGRKNNLDVFQEKQSLANKGLVTVEYPDEKLAVPERFRFVPFLVTYNHDDPEYAGKDWCTSCGICAKVCPPQCIWIVRGTNPETGRPKPEPEAFYIDIDICMNCGYCAEYCPFDAIKMDHDYELASYDRTSAHVYDKPKLSKEIRYWQTIAPTTAMEELVARGGYDHTDVQKSRKKAGLAATRPGPVSDRPQEAVAPAAVAAPAAAAAPAPVAAAPAAAGDQPATTADGRVIVRRGARKAAAAPAGDTAAAAQALQQATAAASAPAAPAPAAPAPTPAPAAAAPTPPPAAAAPTATTAEGDEILPDGRIRRGKRIIDPNAKPTVVRRKASSAPSSKD
ncbi:MAG: 4Fe-4S binding protein [Anaerolineae bacterium]|nr:4Fe-4S binding protein [Anaerolineae bacterium]